jgi:predicted dehydrogenase
MSVLIVGAGSIAREYVEICDDLGREPLLVTRGEERAAEVRDEFPKLDVVTGGLEAYLDDNQPPREAILATPIETLRPLCRALVESGVKRVLAEKPLALSSSGAAELRAAARDAGATVSVAFNRRHYESTELARDIIREAGGVSSFKVDFTEALFRIDPSRYSQEVRRRWGICNASHVIDIAFHLCSAPETMNCEQAGAGAIDWHPSGSIFYGNGETADGAHFTYHADWDSPGRWRIEINTRDGKLLFSPLERLKIQPPGTFEVRECDGDYDIDREYKPGFYRQTERFLREEDRHFMTLDDLPEELERLEAIFGYDSG